MKRTQRKPSKNGYYSKAAKEERRQRAAQRKLATEGTLAQMRARK